MLPNLGPGIHSFGLWEEKEQLQKQKEQNLEILTCMIQSSGVSKDFLRAKQ